jgi:hypothetical protein
VEQEMQPLLLPLVLQQERQILEMEAEVEVLVYQHLLLIILVEPVDLELLLFKKEQLIQQRLEYGQ